MAKDPKDIGALFRGLSPKNKTILSNYANLIAQAEKNVREEIKKKEDKE